MLSECPVHFCGFYRVLKFKLQNSQCFKFIEMSGNVFVVFESPLNLLNDNGQSINR